MPYPLVREIKHDFLESRPFPPVLDKKNHSIFFEGGGFRIKKKSTELTVNLKLSL
jgi:hypothetical protein